MKQLLTSNKCFKDSKTKIGKDLLDIPHEKSVQIQALTWCQAWIDKKKNEEKNLDVWTRNKSIRENYRPLWRRSRTTNAEEQYTQSVEFYGKRMSMEEANEAERWWPQFLLDNTSLQGGKELLLPEITQMNPYTTSSEDVCTDIEPVRVLYNGHNHYQALVLSSTHDTERMIWLRDKISVMALPGLQSDPVDSANNEEHVESPD